MARLFTNHLKTLLWLACLFGMVCSILGVALSRHFLSFYHIPLSTGGLVVTLMGFAYFVMLACFHFKRVWYLSHR
jgi:ABC-type Mn2+/Zn2+ transport system permease subunit